MSAASSRHARAGTACHCSLKGGTQATFLCPEPEQQVPLSLKPNAGATLITSRVQYTQSLDPHESSGRVYMLKKVLQGS